MKRDENRGAGRGVNLERKMGVNIGGNSTRNPHLIKNAFEVHRGHLPRILESKAFERLEIDFFWRVAVQGFEIFSSRDGIDIKSVGEYLTFCWG